MTVPIIAIAVHFRLFKDRQMDLIHPHTPKGGGKKKNHRPSPTDFNEN